MAYMTNQELKKVLVERIKAVLPKGWKASYSMSYAGYSKVFTMTISSMTEESIKDFKYTQEEYKEKLEELKQGLECRGYQGNDLKERLYWETKNMLVEGFSNKDLYVQTNLRVASRSLDVSNIFNMERAQEVINNIVEAINSENYDNSDSMSDYFDVGYYVHLNFGKWDKPCQIIAK